MTTMTHEVKIVNKEYGSNSISNLITQMLADNVSVNVIKDIKLAQMMTRTPESSVNDQNNYESAQFASIMRHNYKNKSQRACHDLEERQEVVLIDKTNQLQYTLAKRELVAKNKKRNAKRRAKAKATKKALNFTPTKEQEKDVEEWFWGEAPTDC
tara:strand:+ start:41 stop:505 length:465 start_codon:yes stop_codon:yes gene_type:complete